MVKSIHRSSRGPGVGSQALLSSSQTSRARNPMPPAGLCRHCTHVMPLYTCKRSTNAHFNKNLIKHKGYFILAGKQFAAQWMSGWEWESTEILQGHIRGRGRGGRARNPQSTPDFGKQLGSMARGSHAGQFPPLSKR